MTKKTYILMILILLMPMTTAYAKTYTAFNGYVNVKSYGAKGDGITNDAYAIQKAENSGKSIYFPKGTYKINSNLTKRTNVNWLGDGESTVLQVGNIEIRNENYGIEDTAYNVGVQPWDYAYKSTGRYDSFEIKNLTIQFRNPLKRGENPEGGYVHVFNFMHTDNVRISNVFMDSDSNTNRGNCIFLFMGGNLNTTIDGCKMIHNTNPSALYGGSVVFASRSTSSPIKNVTISNNNIIKKNGGDELLWFASNFNSIENVTIKNNTITAISNVAKSSIIMFAQDSSRVTKEPFSKITIANNKITANNMYFSTVFVGFDFGNTPRKAETVEIYNNTIQTMKSTITNELVAGILVGRAKTVNIQNNTITGNQDTGIWETENEVINIKTNTIK